MARKTTKKRRTSAGKARLPRKAARKKVTPSASPAPETDRELLDMDQAIGLLKTTRSTFYRWLRSGRIKGMKLGRQWRFYREDIERFLRGKEPKIELPTDIGPLAGTLRRQLDRLGGKAPSAAQDSPVAQVVALTIALAAKMRASDIHFEPYERCAHLRIRVDGVLHTAAEFDIRLLPAIVEQFKRLAACDVREKFLPQDGRILMKDNDAGELDLRVCFLPAVMGEAITVRILKRDDVVLSLDRIDYAPADRKKLLESIEAPWGLNVISGPTGSGKTTVLYACLSHLVDPGRKLMSVEDPVEYLIPGIVQAQIREKHGLTFERVVRSFLRSDPDVIMIGEIRNQETLSAALQSALTGHLILTTLHTQEAAASLKRMVEIGAPPFVVADATALVSAQRLVRCLCRKCSVPAEPPAEQLSRAERLAGTDGLDWDALPKSYRRPVGCPECGQTGYRGRTLIAEMLPVTAEIGSALRDGASVEELRSIAVGEGMTTMAADGVRRTAAGKTTLEEVFRVLSLR